MTENKSNTKLIVIIVILSILSAFLLIDKFFSHKQVVKYETIVEQKNDEKDSLQNELQDMYIEYANLQTNNQQINDSLKAQKERIADLLQEIRNVKSNDQYKIKQMKEEIAVLKDIMKSYIKQIDSLYTQNQNLIAENTTIKKQYNQEIQKTQELTQKTDSLEQKVSVAKKLTAYNIVINTLNDREKTTNRVNKISKFEVCFLLSENQVITKGRKYIYLRIAKPDSEILINDKSGYFNFENKMIAYSSIKEIEYNGQSTNACMYFINPYEDLPAGKYTIFIFADGKQIGDQQIVLK